MSPQDVERLLDIYWLIRNDGTTGSKTEGLEKLANLISRHGGKVGETAETSTAPKSY
jgi:hypothetical protein